MIKNIVVYVTTYNPPPSRTRVPELDGLDQSGVGVHTSGHDHTRSAIHTHLVVGVGVAILSLSLSTLFSILAVFTAKPISETGP